MERIALGTEREGERGEPIIATSSSNNNSWRAGGVSHIHLAVARVGWGGVGASS
jgi:hypothetical protein